MLRTYSVKELRRRPGRTVLTLLGIVIGVAAIVSISITIESTRFGFRDMFDAITGRASLEVIAPGYGGFEDTVSGDLENVRGVAATVPVIQMHLGLMGPAGVVPMLAMGVDPVRDEATRDCVLAVGHRLGPSDAILLETGFAATHGLKTGATARLLTPIGVVELPVAGLLKPTGAAAVNGGAVLFMPLATAQRVFALNKQINAVQIILDKGVGIGRVEDAIRERLPVGLDVQTPAARGSTARHMLLGAELGLSVMSVVSLVAGGFVILNSLLMSLGERTRNFAILRSIGATRSQVTRMLLVEALVLGVVGTGLGIVVGLGMSVALTGVMEQMLGIALPDLRVSPETLLIAAIIGLSVTVAAALVPSMRSGRRPPLEGLIDNRDVREPAYRRWPGYVGVVLIAVTGVLFALLVNESLPISISAQLLPFGMACVIAGGILCIPLTLPWLSVIAAALLRPILRAEGRIALRHLRRRPTRTGLTVAVLAVSVIIAIGFGNALQNSVGNIRKWARQISAVDFFVRAYMPDPNMMTVTAMPEALGDEIAAIDGVDFVHKINFIPIQAGGQSVILIQKTFDLEAPIMIDLEGVVPTIGTVWKNDSPGASRPTSSK